MRGLSATALAVLLLTIIPISGLIATPVFGGDGGSGFGLRAVDVIELPSHGKMLWIYDRYGGGVAYLYDAGGRLGVLAIRGDGDRYVVHRYVLDNYSIDDIGGELYYFVDNWDPGIHAVLSLNVSGRYYTLVLGNKDDQIIETHPWRTIHYYKGLYVKTLKVEQNKTDNKNYLTIITYSKQNGTRKLHKQVDFDYIEMPYKWYILAVEEYRVDTIVVFIDLYTLTMRVRRYRLAPVGIGGSYIIYSHGRNYSYIVALGPEANTIRLINITENRIKKIIKNYECIDEDFLTRIRFFEENTIITASGETLCYIRIRGDLAENPSFETHVFRAADLIPVGRSHVAKLYTTYWPRLPDKARRYTPFTYIRRILVIYRYEQDVSGLKKTVYEAKPLQPIIYYYGEIPEKTRLYPTIYHTNTTLPEKTRPMNAELVKKAAVRIKAAPVGGSIDRVEILLASSDKAVLLARNNYGGGVVDYYIVSLDIDGNKTIYNKRIGEILGYKPLDSVKVLAYYYDRGSHRLLLAAHVNEKQGEYYMAALLDIDYNNASTVYKTRIPGVHSYDDIVVSLNGGYALVTYGSYMASTIIILDPGGRKYAEINDLDPSTFSPYDLRYICPHGRGWILNYGPTVYLNRDGSYTIKDMGTIDTLFPEPGIYCRYAVLETENYTTVLIAPTDRPQYEWRDDKLYALYVYNGSVYLTIYTRSGEYMGTYMLSTGNNITDAWLSGDTLYAASPKKIGNNTVASEGAEIRIYNIAGQTTQIQRNQTQQEGEQARETGGGNNTGKTTEAAAPPIDAVAVAAIAGVAAVAVAAAAYMFMRKR